MNVDLLCGDVLDVLAEHGDETFTACLCDPPYGLSFMGKGWDHGVPGVAYWAEVLRVLKPGGVLMAFGGTRTYHRLACAIEDAGFEIEDCLMWLYGSGFPKSHDISKAIDKAAGAEVSSDGYVPNGKNNTHGGGWGGGHKAYLTAPATPDACDWQGYGTALKPAYEPVIVARKPRGKLTYAECAVRYGSGALWVDGGRVGTNDKLTGSGTPPLQYGGDNHRPFHDNAEPRGCHQSSLGRWPANLILDDDAAALLDEMSGVSGPSWRKAQPDRAYPDDLFPKPAKDRDERGHSDTGGASRFFARLGYTDADADALRFVYAGKASRAERDAGLEGFELRGGHLASPEGGGGGWAKDAHKNPNYPRRNGHPTVKPLAVTRYLARLILPPESYRDDAALLIPFSGVFSEGIGAYLAGWRNITAIDNEAEYVDIGRARIDWWQWAYEQTGIDDPRELLKAARKLEPLPLLEYAEAAQ